MDPEKFRIVRQHVPSRCADGTTVWHCVEMNGWIFDEIERRHGTITFEPGRYKYPRIEWGSLRTTYLHRFVYEMANAGKSIPKGHVLHHANENKFDATVENLVLVEQRVHVKFHLLRRKARKFSPHPKRLLGRRPPSKNLAVTISREELFQQDAARRLQGSGGVQRSHGQLIYELVRAANAALASRLHSLRRQMPWMLANGALRVDVACDPRWDTGRTWRLGLKKPRLKLKNSEEALVLLVVGLGWDLEQVAKEIGVPVEIVSRIRKSIAVENAFEQIRRSGPSSRALSGSVPDSPLLVSSGLETGSVNRSPTPASDMQAIT